MDTEQGRNRCQRWMRWCLAQISKFQTTAHKRRGSYRYLNKINMVGIRRSFRAKVLAKSGVKLLGGCCLL